MDTIVSLTTEQILKIVKAGTFGVLTIGVGLTGYLVGYIKGVNDSSPDCCKDDYKDDELFDSE